MINIAIFDNEYSTCGQVETYVLNYIQKTNKPVSVEVFFNGEDLLKYISLEKCIDMVILFTSSKPGGLEIGKQIRTQMKDHLTQLVFIADNSDNALDYFQLHPLHFITQPVSEALLYECIEKAEMISNHFRAHFTFNTGHSLKRIAIEKIIYFEGTGRKINIVTTEGIESFYGKIKDIFENIKEHRFIHAHNSILINYDYIQEYNSHLIILENGAQLPISQPKRKEVREQIKQYRLLDR